MPLIDTEAIILKSADSGETSRRLTFFSGSEGRFALVARGVRSKGAKAHAGLEPYAIARVSANLKPQADLGTLGRGETVERFARLREDLERLAAAGVFCEVLDQGTSPRLANPRLYEYGVGFLRALDREPSGAGAPQAGKTAFLLAHGLLRITQAMGFAPESRGCVGCGGEADGRWLDFQAGGLMCASCRQSDGAPWEGRDANGMSLESGAATLLRACATRPWGQIRTATDDGPEVNALLFALIRWVSYHLERELKSVRFFQSVQRIGGSGT